MSRPFHSFALFSQVERTRCLVSRWVCGIGDLPSNKSTKMVSNNENTDPRKVQHGSVDHVCVLHLQVFEIGISKVDFILKTHERSHTYTRTHTQAHINKHHTHARTHAYTHIHTHSHTRTYLLTNNAQTHTQIHKHTHTHTHIHTYTQTHTQVLNSRIVNNRCTFTTDNSEDSCCHEQLTVVH